MYNFHFPAWRRNFITLTRAKYKMNLRSKFEVPRPTHAVWSVHKTASEAIIHLRVNQARTLNGQRNKALANTAKDYWWKRKMLDQNLYYLYNKQRFTCQFRYQKLPHSTIINLNPRYMRRPRCASQGKSIKLSPIAYFACEVPKNDFYSHNSPRERLIPIDWPWSL